MRKILLISLILLGALPLFGADSLGRGYTPRACGFDMDNDGIIGEANDDCKVCDGNTATGDYTPDPDGDGIDEDINFIDTVSGVDDATCGAPNDACKTIGWVLQGNNSSYTKWADGSEVLAPNDDPEDIICFKGTTNEYDLNITQDGRSDAPATRTETAPDSYYEYDIVKPNNPTMLVGWDADRDGQYPPFDTGDTAVITGVGTDCAVDLFGIQMDVVQGAADYVEIAHLQISDWCKAITGGVGGGGEKHIIAFGSNHSYVFAHDLLIQDNFREGCKTTYRKTHPIVNTKHIVVENNFYNRMGSYIWRGSTAARTDAQTSGPLTFRWNTLTGWPAPSTANCDGIDDYRLSAVNIWGPGVEHQQFVYNRFIGVDDTYSSGTIHGGQGNGKLSWKQCSQYIYFRRNFVQDTLVGFQGNKSLTACQERPNIEHYFEYNEMVTKHQGDNTTSFWANDSGQGPFYASLADAPNIGTTIYYRNNIAYAVGNGKVNAFMTITFPNFATDWETTYPNSLIQIANNTAYYPNNFSSAASGGGAIWIDLDSTGYEFNNFDIRNNIWALASGLNLESRGELQSPSGGDLINPIIDYNIYTPGLNYEWDDVGGLSFAQYKTNSGYDANSKECTPDFVNAGSQDFHLTDTDTCAKGAGADLSAFISDDYDGDARPQDVTWDAGFDEEAGAGPGPPPTATKCCSG